MESLGDILRSRRRALGLTLQALAERVGCTKGYLSAVETGRREQAPSEELLGRLERVLELEPGQLVGIRHWKATPPDVRKRVMDLQTDRKLAERLAELVKGRGLDGAYRAGELQALVERLGRGEGAPGRRGDVERVPGAPVQVPLINKVVAGYPREFTDLDYPARVADEYVGVPNLSDPDAFAARVVGDSMEPVYREGDVVVFSPMADATDGSDCFVRLERDGETTFKRVYMEGGEGEGCSSIRLQPLNSAYPPRVVGREEVAGMYRAVYVIRAV